MIVIRNLQELKSQKSKVNKGIYNNVEIDSEIITNEFEYHSEEYGPAIIIIEENETKDIYQRYPILLDVEPEDYELVYEDESSRIYRTCYILTQSGFVVYVRKVKDNV